MNDVLAGIDGKRVLITGATGGIGSRMAERFGALGAKVGIHYRARKEEAEALRKRVEESGGEAAVFQADLLETGAAQRLVAAFVERFGGIEVLINNAGAVTEHTHFSALTEEVWERTHALNLKAPFFLTAAAFEHLGSGGRVINISSVNVRYGGSGKSLHYVSAKAALENLTVGFAREGASRNILVNAIRVGVIDTPMRTKIEGYSEADWQKRVRMIPLKRPGTPDDVARLALFLASDSGNFITKEVFTVAGGD